MKAIVIGLGNFGSSLAITLTEMGNEVVGVDKSMDKVETFKDNITHTICLDSTDPKAVGNLPVKGTDIVVVSIGENEGANILSTALMKQLKVKRLASRAISPLHETILEAMGVDEILHPEEETAGRFAKKLNISGIIDSFEVTKDYYIIEAEVPESFDGKTLNEIDISGNYDVVVLTTIKVTEEENKLGGVKKNKEVKGIASGNTKLKKGDILVLFGKMDNIKHLLEKNK